MTKTLQSLLPVFEIEPHDSIKPIRWIIRQGQAQELCRIHAISEMICPDCSGTEGIVCHHIGREHYAWFCAIPKCIHKSTAISETIVRAKKRVYKVNGNLVCMPETLPHEMGIDINYPETIPYKNVDNNPDPWYNIL